MMTEEAMRLWREQMDAWLKLMNPTGTTKTPADLAKAWEGVVRQQMALWQAATERNQKQIEQMLKPFQQQMTATQTAANTMREAAEWFTSEAGSTFKTMRDYYTTLAEIEERLAKLHRLTAEQVEKMGNSLPRFSPPQEKAKQ